MTFKAQIKVWSGANTPTVIGSTSATSTVGHELQVVGKSIFTAGTGTVSSAPYIMGTNSYSSAGSPDYTWKKDSTTGIFHPSPGNVMAFSIGGTERMRLTSNALILGQTTDPGYDQLIVKAASGYRAIESWTNFGYDGAWHEILWVNRAGTHALSIYNTATSTTTATYFVEGSGDCYAKSYTTLSDKNLKENFDTIHGALAKIKQLQGYTYNFKSSATGIANPRKEIGLLAQEVEQVVPEAVTTSAQGVKGITYSQLVPLLIESIKEQERKIAKLESDLGSCCNKAGSRATQGDAGSTDNPADQHLATAAAKLWQNVPNPFSQTTNIKCFIPDGGKTASILIFDLTGALKKTVSVSGKGEVNVTINAKELVAGMYHYSLIIDGQEIDTKKMILTE